MMDKRPTIELHNARVKRSNPPPADVPSPVDDLRSLIAEYNLVEEQQRGRLAKLWSSLASRKGPRFVAFGPGRRWTTNDLRVGEGERDDLRMGRSIEPFTATITEFDLGE